MGPLVKSFFFNLHMEIRTASARDGWSCAPIRLSSCPMRPRFPSYDCRTPFFLNIYILLFCLLPLNWPQFVREGWSLSSVDGLTSCVWFDVDSRYSTTLAIERAKHDPHALWGKEEVFVVSASSYVEMKESNKNTPYAFKEVRHRITLVFRDRLDLIRVSTPPDSGRASLFAQVWTFAHISTSRGPSAFHCIEFLSVPGGEYSSSHHPVIIHVCTYISLT